MSLVMKRSVVLDGHKTSVSLEDQFWTALKGIAQNETKTISNIIAGIDKAKTTGNLSSAIRLFVLDWFSNSNFERPSAVTTKQAEASVDASATA